MTTDSMRVLDDIDAGLLAQKISQAISEAATATVIHGKQGAVTLEIKFKRIGDSNQVNAAHKLTMLKPTQHGSVREESAKAHPLHVNADGSVTLFPNAGESQQDDIFGSRRAGEGVSK